MKIAHCSSCRADVVWLKTSKGKNMPMDADYLARIHDMDDDAPEFNYELHHDGVHWSTCKFADSHRKPK